MLTEAEFAAILDLMLEELSGIVLRDGEVATRTSLPLRVEIDEAVTAIREPGLSRAGVLSTSLGLVDEFIRARQEQIVEELYQEYVKRRRKS